MWPPRARRHWSCATPRRDRPASRYDRRSLRLPPTSPYPTEQGATTTNRPRHRRRPAAGAPTRRSPAGGCTVRSTPVSGQGITLDVGWDFDEILELTERLLDVLGLEVLIERGIVVPALDEAELPRIRVADEQIVLIAAE